MPNPHYLPETCIKVTIINFTVTMDGLTDQLLGDVVKAERPDIEKRNTQLIMQMSADKKKLAEIEADILFRLSNSKGNILDDVELIDTLADSKRFSTIIKERLKQIVNYQKAQAVLFGQWGFEKQHGKVHPPHPKSSS